mmetsp:Transcript_3661/g.9890  ORF Transcript_3661/g.9890 Transcript_3661/m.9890 type:complete len:246 (-) Transcript_3661:4155-4892(-)
MALGFCHKALMAGEAKDDLRGHSSRCFELVCGKAVGGRICSPPLAQQPQQIQQRQLLWPQGHKGRSIFAQARLLYAAELRAVHVLKVLRGCSHGLQQCAAVCAAQQPPNRWVGGQGGQHGMWCGQLLRHQHIQVQLPTRRAGNTTRDGALGLATLVMCPIAIAIAIAIRAVVDPRMSGSAGNGGECTGPCMGCQVALLHQLPKVCGVGHTAGVQARLRQIVAASLMRQGGDLVSKHVTQADEHLA